MYQFFNLFAYCKKLEINKSDGTLEIREKTWWLWKTPEKISFSDIDYVDQKKREITTSFGFRLDGYKGVGPHDVFEIYTVYIITKSPSRKIDLFNFRGHGSVHTGMFGVFAGNDGMVDDYDWQSEKSISFAKLVSDFTGARLWVHNPGKTASDDSIKTKCDNCGHSINSESSSCVYCGSSTPAAPAEQE